MTVWCPVFRRQLEDWLVSDWMALPELFKGIFISGDGRDKRLWEPDESQMFS